MSPTPSVNLSARRSEPILSTKYPIAPLDGASNEAQALPDNKAAFAHNATFPSTTQESKDLPDVHVRKPSEAGLHLQTDIKNTTSVNQDGLGLGLESKLAMNEETSPRLLSKNWDLTKLAHRRSWGSDISSPASTASSPAIGALGDVTPLPSPLSATFAAQTWVNKVGRPHSSSNASIERERAAVGLLAPANTQTSPVKRKKAYGALLPSPPTNFNETFSTPERFRAQSEYVPDHLQNIRQRTVTGPVAPTPPPGAHYEASRQETPLHRELYHAKQRPSIDQGTAADPRRTLPTPPPSLHTPSDEGDDLDRATPAQQIAVRDSISQQTTHWKTLRTLGTGSFSEVFLATRDISSASNGYHIDGKTHDAKSLVAIKVVSHTNSNDEERMDTSIRREIEILQSMSHPCLPHLFAFEDTPSRALLVLNYCPGGDLFEVASTQRDLLTAPVVQRIFAELVAAVCYLHENLIVHRDIKLENVLLNTPLHILPQSDPRTHPNALITLTDLGLAKHLPPPPASPLLTHPCGSVDYAAPEVLLGQPYDGRATDAWALGVLLYALMEGRLPFDLLPNARRRGGNVKHRIARCDWLWCVWGDEDGEFDEASGGGKGREMGGAKECVEGLLRKVGRGRWSVEKLRSHEWVRQGVAVDGIGEAF